MAKETLASLRKAVSLFRQESAGAKKQLKKVHEDYAKLEDTHNEANSRINDLEEQLYQEKRRTEAAKQEADNLRRRIIQARAVVDCRTEVTCREENPLTYQLLPDEVKTYLPPDALKPTEQTEEFKTFVFLQRVLKGEVK